MQRQLRSIFMILFAHALGVVPQRGAASYVLRKDKSTREALPPLTSQTAESHDQKMARCEFSTCAEKQIARGTASETIFTAHCVRTIYERLLSGHRWQLTS